MKNDANPAFSSRIRKTVCRILGLVAGFVLLWLSFYAVKLHDVWNIVKESFHLPFLVCMVFWIFSIVFSCIRWQIMLREKKPVLFFTALKLYVLNLWTNLILPFRAGEAIRVASAHKTLNIQTSFIIATLIIERILNVSIFVIIGFVLTFLIPILKPYRIVLCLIVTVLLLGLLLLIRRRNKCPESEGRGPISNFPQGEKLKAKFTGFLRTIVQGVFILKKPTILIPTVLSSLAYLSMLWFGQFLLIKTIHPESADKIAIAVILFVNIASLLPITAADFGPYQWACIAAFSLFGLEKSTALGFSFVLQGVRISAILILCACLCAVRFIFGNRCISASSK